MNTKATRNYHKWLTGEIEYIKQNYNKESKASLAVRFGVTKESIINIAKLYKLGKPQERPWAEEEIKVLQNCHDKRSDELSRILGRTKHAIEKKRSVLGIGRARGRTWTAGEIALVTKWVGHPIALIKKELDLYCRKHNLSPRSRIAIKLKISKLGESIRPDGYYTVRSLALCLRTSRDTLKTFIESHRRELKPICEARETLVSEDRLRKFAKKYPGEIARFNPDVVWLIALIAGDGR